MSAEDFSDVPELNSYGKVISRGEKKARKALSKLGLKPVEGVTRVAFKVNNNVFAISQPEVLKAPGAETYVVFGEAAADDLMQRLQMAASQGMGANAFAPSAAGVPPAADEEDDGEEVDAGDLAEDDIVSVVEQAGVSRNKAIKALQSTGTVVDAIISLSS